MILELCYPHSHTKPITLTRNVALSYVSFPRENTRGEKPQNAKKPPLRAASANLKTAKNPWNQGLFFLSILSYWFDAGNRTWTGTRLLPRDFKSLASANSAMPAKLTPDKKISTVLQTMPLVSSFHNGKKKTTQIGLEPTTSAVTGRRSNQLSH